MFLCRDETQLNPFAALIFAYPPAIHISFKCLEEILNVATTTYDAQLNEDFMVEAAHQAHYSGQLPQVNCQVPHGINPIYENLRLDG